MVPDFQIFFQSVKLVAAKSFTAVLKGRKTNQTKTGMKLCSWWRIFMLVISDAIMRQDLIKNISTDKASLGLKEGNDFSSNIRRFGLSTCLMLELASLQVLLVRYPARRMWWRAGTYVWVLWSQSEILFSFLKQGFQYNSVSPPHCEQPSGKPKHTFSIVS